MRYLFLIALALVPAIAAAQDTGFVSLTQVPFLENSANSFNLTDFLNNLYRLAIGAAAVIAVLQIMRAGIMYMGGDSVTEKKEAKNLIGLSIAGLILVLSPVIVFSVINPEILSLKIDSLGELVTKTREFPNTGGVDPAVLAATAWTNTTIDRQAEKAVCESQGRTMVFACRSENGTERSVPETEACQQGETNVNRCLLAESERNLTCPANLSRVQIFTNSCPADTGYAQVAKSCCSLDASDPRTCCGSTDGRGPEDPSISSFYGQKTFESRPGADAYAQACSDIRSFNRIVSGREGDVKQLPRPEGSVNTPFVARCFSYSIVFREYQLWERSTNKVVQSGGLDSGDIDSDSFENGCVDEGGKVFFRRAIRPSFSMTECTQAERQSIINATPGASFETHTPMCRSNDYVCRQD